MTPLLFLGIRFICAGLIVGSFDLLSAKKLSDKDIIGILLTGSLLGIQTSLWGIGLYHAQHLGIGSFLVSLSFLLIPVTGMLFGLSVQRSTWFALSIAGVGLLLLFSNRDFTLRLSDSYFLLSAILYAFYFNCNGRLSGHVPTILLTSYQLVIAGFVCFAGYFIFEFNSEQTFNALFSVLGWVLASILIATSLRFFILVKALSMKPKSQGALIMTLEPIWVTLLAVIFFEETLTSIEICGIILICIALLTNTGVGLRHLRWLVKLNVK